jgi:hypothetical protein
VNYFDAVASGCTLYRKLFEHRNRGTLMALDDIEPLWKSQVMLGLLKGAFGNGVVSWLTEYGSFKAKDEETGERLIPETFQYDGKLAIVSNFFPSLEAYAPVYDRALLGLILFMPDNPEIHRYAGTWFDKAHHRDIYDFIGNNLDRILSLSVRCYGDAAKLKMAGKDWRRWLEKFWENREEEGDPNFPRAMQVFLDAGFKHGKEKADEFERLTGLRKSSWHVYKKLCQQKLGLMGRQRCPSAPGRGE